MICRNCRTNNLGSSIYCESCGSLMIRKPSTKKKIIQWYVLVFLMIVMVAGAYFVYKMTRKSNQEDLSSHPAANREVATKVLATGTEEIPMKTGGVVVIDLQGTEISSCASAVLSDSWIAAPVWLLLRGKSLVIETAESQKIAVEKGVWTSGDPIMLLKLTDNPLGKTQKLSPWRQYMPVEWRPYHKNSSIPFNIPNPEKRGTFLSFRLPHEVQEPGVFMQEGHVVGWAFPEWLDNGYLWGGPSGAELSPSIHMDEFFHSILADWRETRLENLLSRGKSIPSVRRLEAFADVLGMDSRFASDDVPHNLRMQSIVKHMHSLASNLINNGMAEDVARILDRHTIIEAGDITLLKDSVTARVESEDYNRALQHLERIKKEIYEKGRDYLLKYLLNPFI